MLNSISNNSVVFDGTHWSVIDEFICAERLTSIDGVRDAIEHSRAKREAAASAVEHGVYCADVMHRRPAYRLGLLNLYTRNGLISHEKAWRIARDSWIEADNVSNNRVAWMAFFKEFFASRQYFMNDREIEHFATLPDQIKIYRGYKSKRRNGISWTMSKLIASQFSPQTDTAIIAQGMVNKSDVVGYIGLRGQHEIVLRSDDVVVNQRAVNAVRPEQAMNWVIKNKGVLL